MESVKLFLCGDVMTGRGIDQILRQPCSPELYEPYVKNAVDYVRLAERVSGAVPRGVDDAYIWGDALEELDRVQADVRVINLETSVTRSGDWQEKGINYRMHPANVGCLTVARTNCCALANNHVLDWGESGLEETVETLRIAGMHTAGAGVDDRHARAPAVMLHGPLRIIVYSVGTQDSGIPPSWQAAPKRPGVDFLPDLSASSAARLAERIRIAKQDGALVIVSIHWGGNWGYRIPAEQLEFAHRLIDEAGVDLVHGHSSHHPKGVELYRGKLILYGCGDFINDYEGISGHDEFRSDLGLMYFPRLDAASGRLIDMELVALCRRRFRLQRASEMDCAWLRGVLNTQGERFGLAFSMLRDSRFRLAL